MNASRRATHNCAEGDVYCLHVFHNGKRQWRMKKTKKQIFTEQELAGITSIQQTTGVSRKTAIKKLRKDPDHYLVKNTKAAVAPAKVKQAAETNGRAARTRTTTGP
jgi:hypothetical protein